MGTRTIYVDDLDGTDLGADTDATVAFSLQGKSYTIDLSKKNRDALTKALEKYIAVATRSGNTNTRSRARSRTRTPAVTPAAPSESEAIREWAASEGIEVSPRGRIAAAVREQYLAATKGKK